MKFRQYKVAWALVGLPLLVAPGLAHSNEPVQAYEIVVHAPDRKGRAAILRVHTRKVPLGKDVDLKEIAASTPGMTGADLANLVNEAALLAARRGQQEVFQRDLTDALYNPLTPPYVSHERGTELAVEHVEKYWCPTFASTDLTGKPAFRFKEDKRN